MYILGIYGELLKFYGALLWESGLTMNRFRSNLGCSSMVSEKVHSPNMGTWSKYGPILFKFTTHIECFKDGWKTEYNIYWELHGDLSGTDMKFWGTLQWVLGLNMDWFRSNFAHLFTVTENIYKSNMRQIVYILWVLWGFKWHPFEIYGPILFKFTTNIECFKEVLKTEFERDSAYIVSFMGI